ncbi:hypothetical protein ASPWEDRAFT_120224 [Aspergillus wentii DTO 134E9]|uniref:Peptidase M43 pregnancy-associated plasma-A domain-containing protein n=1 Tax=Aspergillus wentii DTO 134E9 TaxID=1073089 RepID=A0A1L9R746_ASPWE|nr:uncharacterized protein ASPWEDRAFT_120224 [Aspergillus wentii DTO 134E9]OJJ30742.1 hypothetical protein ASPWEDRAFT_120224 [Aspergillus wentii DTO 134E9]
MFRLGGLQLLFILTIATIQCQHTVSGHHARAFCATHAPNDRLKAAHKHLSADEMNQYVVGHESRERVTPIEIETWFHIVSSEEESEIVTDGMINEQLSYLQNAYENVTISYRLEGITRSVNNTWAHNADDLGMKAALRRGSYSTLNVYFQTNLQASHGAGARAVNPENKRNSHVSNQLSSSVLGFCTLPDPSVNASSPRSAYVKDGCNVLAKTMPGGSLMHYNRGGTAIHEIGHWNGLLHTFEGESCSPDNPGDYIADTPVQSIPTDGCPARKNSCPDSPGLDAIHNFMDYSSDECYETFTPGQMKRMRGMWSSMREGK